VKPSGKKEEIDMGHRLIVFAVGFLACGAYGLARQDASIPFPADYRKWTHVKSTLVGPESPAFARNGGYHHFYANAAAMEGYRTGTFADGSILIDDGLEAATSAGVMTEGPRRRVAVMVKDSARFRDSQGWGFEVFLRDERKGSLTLDAKAACLACHQKAERNLVFSKFRE
jgi:hypothetical protein